MSELSSVKEIFPKADDIDVNLTSGEPLGMFSWLVRAGEIVPAWWSRRRDIALRKTVIGNDNLSGAQYNFISRLTSTPVHIVPKDKSISSHVEQAQYFDNLLQYNTVSRSDRSRRGWNFGFGMFLQDLTGVDNGGIFVIEGPGRGDGPLTGAPTGLVHLDSLQVTRTRSREFPIVYTDYDGKKYKIHHSRTIIISSMPSSTQSMYGIGLCAISRCIHVSQILLDQLVYKEEKLGSRPKERLIVGKKGITGQDIANAFYTADQSMNNEGLTRYSKTVVLAPNSRASSAEIDLEIQDLVDAGTIFDEQTSTTLGMYTIALAFGVPARWFWPATATGATKADAEIQHLIGMQEGPGEILRGIKEALDLKFLPPHLEVTFDYQDDAQDRDQAEIKKIRADQRKTDIEDGVISIRVAREQALDRGDITQAQFDGMELQDGRLPNGDALLAAFSNKRDVQLMEMLFLGVAEPLAIDENDPFEMIIAIDDRAIEVQSLTQNASTAPLKRKARIALHALGELKKLYEQKATDILAQEIKEEMEIMAQANINAEPVVEQAMPPEVSSPESSEEETQEESPEEMQEGEKQYNFGARGGEIIGGGLARDLEGKFISKDELASAIRQKLLDRLRGKRGLGQYGEEYNRDAVGAELGSLLPAGAMDGLAVLGVGQPLEGPLSDRLISGGLARVDNTGQTRLTTAGASLLIAANKGDIERAKDALIRAQTQIGKGRAGGGGGGGSSDQTEEERAQEELEKEAANRKNIAEKLKGSANQVSSEQIEAMEQVRLGNEVASELAQSLADRGLLEYDDNGIPYLSFDGRVFINAANQNQLSLVRDVLARSAAKYQRKLERIDRLDTNISDVSKMIEELNAEIETYEGAQTLPDITERAQLQNRANELADRLYKDQEEVKTLRTRIGKQVVSLIDEKSPIKVDMSEVKGMIDSFFGVKGGEENFQLSVRSAFRQLWAGLVEEFDFVDEMVSAITRGLTRAWAEGAKEEGIDENELTEAERNALDDLINGQFVYLPGLAEDIVAIREAAKENGVEPGFRNMPQSLFDRASLWVNRYKEAKNLAKVMAAGNKKLKWIYGDTEHCEDCDNYNDRVYRASTWAKYDIRPQSHRLACKGFRCKCRFEDTEDPLTLGAPPSPQG